MSNKKSFTISNLDNWILSISKFIIYLIFCIVLLEIGAKLTRKIYGKLRTDTALSTTKKELPAKEELGIVQRNSRLSAHRGFKNKSNFKGNHVITDQYGFRIDQTKINEKIKVGLFGGSTVFSVYSSQNETIPDQMSNLSNTHQFLNFGIGGYSSGTEIMTFIESLRAYPDIEVAIFYDGVNELGNANGGLPYEDNPNYASEELIGHPYQYGYANAFFRNKLAKFSFMPTNSNFYYIFSKFITKRKAWTKDINSDTYLKNISNRYVSNVKVINGICNEYKIKCFYIWQPNIHTVNPQKLSEKEKQIVKNDFWGKPYKKLTQIVMQDAASKDISIHDFSKMLDSKNTEIFLDNCHVTPEGNRLIAEQIYSKFF